jgi:hypothetical protein
MCLAFIAENHPFACVMKGNNVCFIYLFIFISISRRQLYTTTSVRYKMQTMRPSSVKIKMNKKMRILCLIRVLVLP